MGGSIASEATPVLPHEAAFHLYPSSDDHLRLMMMMEGRITISQTYSRPMGSTSRITVWKHRNSQDRPTSFTITENFFINQVITGTSCLHLMTTSSHKCLASLIL
jgi:hypothetical protein